MHFCSETGNGMKDTFQYMQQGFRVLVEDSQPAVEVTVDIQEQLYNIDRSITILLALNEIPIRYKLVLVLRFYHELTYDEIGNVLGVTRERVRQIVLKGLRLMRHPKRAKQLKRFAKLEGISNEN